MALERDDAQALLAEPLVAVIAVEEDGRPPLAVPIWYSYAPGGDVWVITERGSLKARALRAARTCTLVVDEVQPRTRYVSVACDLVDERRATPADGRAMAERYLPPDAVEGYLEFAGQNIGAEVVLTLRPTRWRSADLTVG